jgi:tetratricopeptide (TPR) repeat protein
MKKLTALWAAVCLLSGSMVPAISAEPSAVPPATEATVAPPAAVPPKPPKIIWKPGQDVEFSTESEDLNPTDNLDLARKQAAKYPDNPEAAFILAVALTRTSKVEEAVKEVQRARRLADSKGGPAYFDQMIGVYEQLLQDHPEDNRIRYGLAWAYYMKAYLLSEFSRKLHRQAERMADKEAGSKITSPLNLGNAWEAAAATPSTSENVKKVPHIKGALEQADATMVPQIRNYYEKALGKLDELLAQKPDDIWAKVYRAFLSAEYTGNLDSAMETWRACQIQSPDNPAPYFFLGEGYLRQGNLKECLNHISRAIALRAAGK